MAEVTAEGATRSGFTRPSIVGPTELYGSRTSSTQETAPTASALGEVAGSATLPAAFSYSSASPIETKRSKRGDVVAE